MLRSELGILYQQNHFTGLGAEIGVERGLNALNILKHYKGLLYCIDEWSNIESYKTALKNLNCNRCIRLKSADAVDLFSDGCLDFIYIDADHTYNAVKQDLELWYPKVRQGGIISGHDYIEFQDYGVIQAVDELIEHHKKQLFLIDQFDGELNFKS
jgi:predicted O-methyltransferase YrrM